MVLNENSWHARLFKVFFDKGLPNNLCKYFWGLVLAIVCLPVIWPALMLRINPAWRGEGVKGDGIWGILFGYALAVALGAAGYEFLSKLGVPHLWSITLGLPSLLLLISIVIYAAYLADKYHEKKRNGSNIVSEYIRAKKEKICPKIEWKSKNEAK